MKSSNAIICPHCGYKHEGWWELVDFERDSHEFHMPCEECTEEFEVNVEVERTFTTNRPGRPSTGKYGGIPTIISNLPIGTRFYVCNGAWNGVIVEVHGDKCLLIKETEKVIPLHGRNADYELDIEIEERN